MKVIREAARACSNAEEIRDILIKPVTRFLQLKTENVRFKTGTGTLASAEAAG
jgi:hypothetical protein